MMGLHAVRGMRVLLSVLWTCTLCTLCTPSHAQDTPGLKPRPAWTQSRLRGTPEPPAPFRVAPAFPEIRFDKPTSLVELPGRRLLVTEMGGKIFSFPQTATARRVDLVLDLNSLLAPDLADQGVALFSGTPHPDFARNRQLFVCYVHPGKGGHTRVSRFTLDKAAAPRAVTGS